MSKAFKVIVLFSVVALALLSAQQAEAKPIFFNFFGPQTRTSTSTSSTTTSTQFTIPDLFTTKLQFLQSFLSLKGFSYTASTTTTTTEKPGETTELETVYFPDTTESLISSSSKATTEASTSDKSTSDESTSTTTAASRGEEDLSEEINGSSTTGRGYEYSTTSGYVYTSAATTEASVKETTTKDSGYAYKVPEAKQVENEISNQYLPPL